MANRAAKKCVLIISILIGIPFLVHAKRFAPAPVKPIVNAGLRFEAIPWASDDPKMKQNGGFVRVVNIRNGLPLCTKQVYETKYDAKLEQDIQDNFITSLKVEKGHLIVSSESLAPISKPLLNFCD